MADTEELPSDEEEFPESEVCAGIARQQGRCAWRWWTRQVPSPPLPGGLQEEVSSEDEGDVGRHRKKRKKTSDFIDDAADEVGSSHSRSGGRLRRGWACGQKVARARPAH